MKSSSEQIIIFTRYPQPGKTKTRLIPTLGSSGAADLHRQMTEHTMTRVKQLAATQATSVQVCHAGGDNAVMKQWLGAGILFQPQGSGDLGMRMERAFAQAFQAGYERVIIVGTDCPALTAKIMQAALEALQENDFVLGPTSDGGYYLIGLRRPAPQLFQDVPWGTEKVLERTLQIADQLDLRRTLLDLLDDVDRPEDLVVWERESQSRL
jgi:rSAM/selenodomain-associated transferase 1